MLSTTVPSAITNLFKSNKQHRRQQQSRKRKQKSAGPAPAIADRESSLYYYPDTDIVSEDTATATPSYPHHITLNPRHLVDDEDCPLYFPTPPPRLELSFDTRHTDLWDELWDFAEQYQPDPVEEERQQQHQQSARARLGSLFSRTVLDLRLGSSSRLDLSTTLQSTQQQKSSKLGRKWGMRSEIWSKTYDTPSTMTATAAPTIPPRSRLRAQAPPPIQSTSSYLLPVEEPLVQTLEDTPSLSSSASSDVGSPREVPMSPEQETVVFGRNKKKASLANLSKDPLRIRDGASSRSSSSGVYTPLTFPGAQGPRPSHFPSHVYTPNNFTLNPTAPRPTPNNYAYEPAGPSRSPSYSSTESMSPQTPNSINSRFSTLSGKTRAGFKRISHQITSLNSSGSSTPVPVTPHSARDSYFPHHIAQSGDSAHSRQSSLGPQTPTSATRPSFAPYAYSSTNSFGLGVGLTEQQDGRTGQLSPDTFSRKSGSVVFDQADQKSPQAKGRRKPVPRMLGDDLTQDLDGLQLQAHAL